MIIYNKPSEEDYCYTDKPKTYTSYTDYASKATNYGRATMNLIKRNGFSYILGEYCSSQHYIKNTGNAWCLTDTCVITYCSYMNDFGACQKVYHQQNIFTSVTPYTRFSPYNMLQYKTTDNFRVFICYCNSSTSGYIHGKIVGNLATVCPLPSAFCMQIEKINTCCTIKVNGTAISNNGYFCYGTYASDYTNGYAILYPSLICKDYGTVKYYEDK